jgi:hypothetical protein
VLKNLDMRASLESLVIIRDDRLPVRRIPLREKPLPRYVLPYRGLLGLALIALFWPASWLHLGLLGHYSFFPLWLGYILTLEGLVLRRTGTSLIQRNPWTFAGMFVIATPFWWFFEGVNQFTENWNYLGNEDRSTLHFILFSSWAFSIVVPAVLETAEYLGSTRLLDRLSIGPSIKPSTKFLTGTVITGVICLVALAIWPRYAFPVTWLGVFFILDPINYLQGRPSILAAIRHGDWRLPWSLALGALICGFFWEMWNVNAVPKWEYDIAFVEVFHIFEMPVLGYGGYLPFGLETFAAYHFFGGLIGWSKGALSPKDEGVQPAAHRQGSE